MHVKLAICNRCGIVIEEPHPDRISVAHQHYEEHTDHWGKPHRKSVYKADPPIHLCSDCNKAFHEFLEFKR